MGFFKKDEIGILGLFYLGNVISHLLSVTEPIIIIYFALKGFSFSELSFALAAYFVATFFFEVPTGAIADTIGRKKSVILSLFLMGITLILVPFVNNFLLLTLLFTFVGFAKTLSTGADQAWIIDNLKYNRKSDLIKEYYIKSSSFNMAAFVFSGLLAAGLIKTLGENILVNFRSISLIGLDFLWFIEGCSTIIVAILFLFIREHFVSKKTHPKHLFKHSMIQFKSGFKHSFDNPVIFHLIVAAFFGAIGGGIFGIIYQPFLIDLGVPTYYLGYMMSIIGALGIFIPFIAKRLLVYIKREKYYLSFTSIIQAILIFSAFFIISPFAGLTLIILLSNIGQLEKPIQRPYFQNYLKSKIRATVASFESMFVHIGGGIAMILGGVLADAVGPRTTFAAAGIFIIPMIISYLTIHERKDK